MTSTDVVADHRAAGRAFTAAGLTGFVREAGDGETVLCMHGVPTSSFLYRKVLDELAARNVRCVAFDLPGLGLADRPENFDYTWTGLGQYSVAAIEALELQSFHLVVHDVGGPVGFELAAAVPDRVKSLTVLNTIVDVDTFKRPWSMEPRDAGSARSTCGRSPSRHSGCSWACKGSPIALRSPTPSSTHTSTCSSARTVVERF